MSRPSSPPVARGRLPRLRHFFLEYLLALPLGVGVALVWSAWSPESYYTMAAALSFPTNSIAMVFFFGLITKEVVEATTRGGALHPWRRTALPVMASFAAAVVTLMLFGVFVRSFGEPMLERGWASTLGVDIAFGYFVARVIFGRGPLVALFLLIAVASNAFGFVAVAMSEPPRDVHPWPLMTLVGVGMAAAYAGRFRRINAPAYYLLAGGVPSWLGMYFGGAHPALALLPIVPFLPGRRRDPGFFVDAPEGANDALERLELVCRHPAQLALFLFGAVNAGVPAASLELGVLALPLAAVVGRPAGLLLGLVAARVMGLPLPMGIHSRDLVVLGLVSAVGFTMTLFFATAVLGPGQILMELRAGALLTVISAPLAIMTAWALHVGRFAHGSRDASATP